MAIKTELNCNNPAQRFFLHRNLNAASRLVAIGALKIISIMAALTRGRIVMVNEGISALTGETVFVGDLVVKSNGARSVSARFAEVIQQKLNIPVPAGRVLSIENPVIVKKIRECQKNNQLGVSKESFFPFGRTGFCKEPSKATEPENVPMVIYVQEKLGGFESTSSTRRQLKRDVGTLSLLGRMAAADIALGYLDLFIGRHQEIEQRNLGNLLIGPNGELIKIDTDRLFEAEVSSLLGKIMDGSIFTDMEEYFLQARMIDRPFDASEKAIIRKALLAALADFTRLTEADLLDDLPDLLVVSAKPRELSPGYTIQQHLQYLFLNFRRSQSTIAEILDPF